MRLLLVNVINPKRQVETSLRPLGLAYLASSLRADRADLELEITHTCSSRLLDRFRPHMVGLSSVTQNFGLAARYARMCKDFGAYVIAGGVHITMLPESLTRDMDAGVLGEGEETMVEVVRLLAEGNAGGADLKKVKGVVFHDPGGGIQSTGRRPLIDPLDRIPYPARDLLYRRTGNIYLVSSRGCPFDCRFCASSSFWAKARSFSAGYVLDEIRSVAEAYRPSHISFWDDLFAADRKRLGEIAEGVNADGIAGRIAFSATCRAELVDEEIVGQLKGMNVVQVSMGLESGSNRILKSLKGGGASVEKNGRAVKLLVGAGIRPVGSFVIGAPEETVEDLERTLAFIREMPLARVGVFVLTPLPGTDLWNEAKAAGLVHDTMNWDDLAIDLDHNPRKIIMASRIPRRTLLRWYARLRREARRKSFKSRMTRFLRAPGSLPASARRRLSVMKEHLVMRFTS